MTIDRGAAASVDSQQARHFDALADEWWAPSKGFRQLNRESTLRQDYIRKILSDSRYLRSTSADEPLAGPTSGAEAVLLPSRSRGGVRR